MNAVLSLGATIGWAAVLWCLFVAGTVTYANVRRERAKRRRGQVTWHELLLGWALVIVAYCTAALTLWALWQLGSGRWGR